MDILNLDVNELISERVTAEIARLRGDLEKVNTRLREERRKVSALERDAADNADVSELLVVMRESFASIKRTQANDSDYYDSREKNRFRFIRTLMELLFGIKGTYGWVCSCDYGTLGTHLAINYYGHKDEVIKLVNIFHPDPDRTTASIRSFKMPYDYGKQSVINYVKDPHYCTNGASFGVSSYWVERGAGRENMPHDFIMRNPHILEPDVFDILINTVMQKKRHWDYLFALPKYNNLVSDEQIARLGECLIGVTPRTFRDDLLRGFVKENMSKFNDKTLDYFYKITRDGFDRLNWQNFPEEYQMKFIRDMGLERALKALTNYSCKLSTESKAEILREFLNEERDV